MGAGGDLSQGASAALGLTNCTVAVPGPSAKVAGPLTVKAACQSRMGFVFRFLATVFVAAFSFPSAALAHSNSVETNPLHGAMLEKLPAEATVTFNEAPKKADLALTTPDGQVHVLRARIAESTVTVNLPAAAPRGRYLLAYRVVSADGHPVSGVASFTVTSGPKPVPTPTRSAAPSADDASDQAEGGIAAPMLVVLGLALVALVVMASAAARARRQ